MKILTRAEVYVMAIRRIGQSTLALVIPLGWLSDFSSAVFPPHLL